MPHPSRRARHQALALLGTAAIGIGSLATLGAGPASAAAAPTLAKSTFGAFGGILSSSGKSLYVLSKEKGAKLHCTSSCLTTWLPLEVATSVKSVHVGAGVEGKVGFVRRTASRKQVTYNGYPLYTYHGDTSKQKANGEALVAIGGRAYLVHAAAKTAGTTAYIPLIQAADIPGYKNVLQVGTTSLSLYLLTAEQGNQIVCQNACLQIWPPLTVSTKTTAITVGAGVKGKIGFVSRSGSKQVTYNSFPLYTYYGDSATQANGEGIVADGGTWYLVSAPATSAGSSPVT